MRARFEKGMFPAAVACLVLSGAAAAGAAEPARPIGIAIHGGAGGMTRGSLTPAQERDYREKLTEALTAGHDVLAGGGTSLDAVEKAIVILEDSPLFNAGRGAVFTRRGTNELDAAIMDGGTLGAGAVAGVTRVRNPIALARRVMERTTHVLLVGQGAEAFAREQKMELVPRRYFYTERRWRAHRRALAAERRARDSVRAGRRSGLVPGPAVEPGTVGCVALDRLGNLAAGTSTGGTNNKRYGRVGDAPIVGAGTYADNRTCAVSATGAGEYFIRTAAAHSVAALMEHRGFSVQRAADSVVVGKVGALGGRGGLVAIDRNGRVAVAFNTAGMFRAHMDEAGRAVVEIYGRE